MSRIEDHKPGEVICMANNVLPGFAERLVRLRTDAGYTQVELAEEIGVSQRMIAHYETVSNPPIALLPKLAKALGVTLDQLFGLESVKPKKLGLSRLHRKLRMVERLPPLDRRQVITMIESLAERAELKEKLG